MDELDPVNLEYCDLVMKGGVTSGIVYPLAVCELAKKYRFRNVGGTSAGAIAAAATAAAELGRRKGLEDRYKRLAAVPGELGRNRRLLTLFQPDPATEPIFAAMLSVLTARGTWGRARTLAGVLLRRAPLRAWVLLTAWAIVPLLMFVGLGGPPIVYAILAALWLLIGGAVLLGGTLASFIQTAMSTLPDNGYGLCSGLNADAPPGVPPLTVWLSQLLNDLAATTDDAPLTFGDLWTAPLFPGEAATKEPVINLEVVTTSLTEGRPYRVPLIAWDEHQTFYFDPSQWRRLFPEPVVAWMERKSDPKAPPVATLDGATVIPLPPMLDLPVLVAARMSLSFPLLISAVPLYAVDFTREENRTPTGPRTAERCWFSDGGIASNFPIHFFDAPLPRWPTFGINLRPPHPDYDRTSPPQYVWLPQKITDWVESWERFDQGTAARRLKGFVQAILSTMQNWRDNLQTRVPGYWDRIVNIGIEEGEGGLSLGMDAGAVTRLSDRGAQAGQLLEHRFDWTNHAWVRYRSVMAALEGCIGRFREACLQPLPPDRAVWDLIQGRAGQPPSYPWTEWQAGVAPAETRALVDLSRDWQRGGSGTFTPGAPEPAPEARFVPPI